jgi:transcriptional regulator GlxA family with amidase domain
VEVDPEALFVRDGNVFTAAGIAAGIDLTLALVEDDLGANAARTTAKVLVVFLQRPGGQSQFSMWTTGRAVKNETLRAVLDAVALHPASDHSLPAMADRANFSVRHLSRLFEEHVGMSPGSYVERVRLEAARAMLEGTDDELSAIAHHSGLGSPESLRRVFVRELGTSPGAYRARFRTTGIDQDADITVRWKPSHPVPVSPLA